MKIIENQWFDVTEFILKDDGTFPNSHLPVLIYRSAFEFDSLAVASAIEKVFEKNCWSSKWRNGIYNYHHYHSTAHEAVAVYKGCAVVLIGGEKGIILKLQKGDVIVFPAGVAHKCIENSHDFKCIGAYPENQDYDMNYGKAGERPQTDHNIENVILPVSDPVFGSKGPLNQFWKNNIELDLISEN
jgi:uncharacterized protein YjlB